MSCPRCGRNIERGWNFCPFCGFRPSRTPPVFGGAFSGIFNSLMKRLAKQMEEMDRQTKEMQKSFENDFEVLDLSPMFRETGKIKPEDFRIIGKPNARGFTIRIASSGGQPPKVDVKTFGSVDEGMQKQINEQLNRIGMRIRTSGPSVPAAAPRQQPTKGMQELRMPKVTEEPKTSVRRIDSKVIVDMEIPGVKLEEDIDICELESSVEVRALAGDKAYFKILTKPEQFRLRQKKFSNGKLHMEFA